MKACTACDAMPVWLRPSARRLWAALLVLLLFAVAWFAFTPAPPRAIDTGWDKVNHALAFTALTLVAKLAAWPQPRHRLHVTAGLLVFGVCIELVQAQLPTRTAEAADVLADLVGIGSGLLLAAALLARRG